jgi:hypothetical protein
VLSESSIEAFVGSAGFAAATVVFVFLVPAQLAEILPLLQRFLARPGTRLISERFEVAGLECAEKIATASSEEEATLGATADAEYFKGSRRPAAFLYRSTCRDA